MKVTGFCQKLPLYQPHRRPSTLPPVLADITPVILTYNESANIGRSLERVTWAREVVIVDSGSTDDTLAIAARFANTRVVHRPFDSHSRQWKFATSETGVTSGWIMRLDADYM